MFYSDDSVDQAHLAEIRKFKAAQNDKNLAMSIKCKCGKDAYAYRTTRWGRDAVCRECNVGYPAEGSFEPFKPLSPNSKKE